MGILKDYPIDWQRVLYTLLASRGLDDIEENRLVPEKKVLYQFSARGHDLAQIILGSFITEKMDAVSAYYRSRPMLLTLGLTLEDAFSGPLMKSGGFSDGRDIGVVCNLPARDGPKVLPMSGDVGSQYTPAAGWAQALEYRRKELGDKDCENAIAVVLGGDGSVATNGFWSALTIATTLKLPLLFYIEDNGYGISVPSSFQTPGGNIAENLSSFKNLFILEGDGSSPEETAKLSREAILHVRSRKGPALLRLSVPRLSGHSGQDTQAYKPEEFIQQEKARDPLPALKKALVPEILSEETWRETEAQVKNDLETALSAALSRPEPDKKKVTKYIFAERLEDGTPEPARMGGLRAWGVTLPEGSSTPRPEATRINMVTAIRRTLQHELKVNPRLLIFGEDVGPKGGVHAATLGLQEEFGEERVFDTSLSEEGIIGRATGMALCGLMPCPEIQFRKYADPATEQLHNAGFMRWRTANRFAAPMVVRIPGGFFKCGDPWHSISDEVIFAHFPGWQVAMPSNAEDAVGLLRAALRSDNPTIFFEHRAMLDSTWARRPYPGDDYVLPFGRAATLKEGSDITVVTWGAMVERVIKASEDVDADVEIIDLRTIIPWDRKKVLSSVQKTGKLLVVHEDTLTAGFGAEIAATVAKDAFFDLDAPVERLAVPDIPIPHNVSLMQHVLPSVDRIADKIEDLVDI